MVFSGGKDEVSAEVGAQALVLMWDENLITLDVHSKLRSKVRSGDVILVDYRPIDKLTVPVPRQVIIKILKGVKAKNVWAKYTEYHEKRKRSASRPPTAAPGYIG